MKKLEAKHKVMEWNSRITFQYCRKNWHNYGLGMLSNVCLEEFCDIWHSEYALETSIVVLIGLVKEHSDNLTLLFEKFTTNLG